MIPATICFRACSKPLRVFPTSSGPEVSASRRCARPRSLPWSREASQFGSAPKCSSSQACSGGAPCCISSSATCLRRASGFNLAHAGLTPWGFGKQDQPAGFITTARSLSSKMMRGSSRSGSSASAGGALGAPRPGGAKSGRGCAEGTGGAASLWTPCHSHKWATQLCFSSSQQPMLTQRRVLHLISPLCSPQQTLQASCEQRAANASRPAGPLSFTFSTRSQSGTYRSVSLFQMG
mmetsp:Transcript_48893/g.126060  ORF Transcript_48893/g.126060 Transcript_48893/m.126060 type:complete len:236 (-) Transcript_48893:854-1561(-)